MNKEAENGTEKETKKSYMKEMYKNCNGRAAGESFFVFRVINCTRNCTRKLYIEIKKLLQTNFFLCTKLRNREWKDKYYDKNVYLR